MRKCILSVLVAFFIMTGCATNPVTGRNELSLVSESQEIQVGREQYVPSRQMQGGDYLADPQVGLYVSEVGRKLSAVSDRNLPYEFKVLNNSTPNAWALPGGKIAVNRGLLTELKNEAELAAVLSHEMVHAAARHGAKAMERGMLLQGAVAVTGIAMSDSAYGNLGVLGAQLASTLVTQKYSRDAERESDMYGMEYMTKAGYDPAAAASLQEVFVKLSESKRQDWVSGMFSSHPPSMERVEANRKKALELGAGGALNAEKYRQVTANLVKNKDAYKAHDQGREALSKGDLTGAMAFAEKALKAEPKEALFHGLRGDIRFKQERYQDALENYNKAIAMNPQFFQFLVQRGLTRQKLNDAEGAKMDFESSMKMLPTATAQKALGDISYAKNDFQSAKNYYSAAARSQGSAGKEALGALVRMDLPSHPDQYVQAKVGLNKNNVPMLQIANPTPVGIRNIQYTVRFVDAAGKIRELNQTYQNTIQPGKSAIISLGMSPVSDTSVLRHFSASIVAASVAK